MSGLVAVFFVNTTGSISTIISSGKGLCKECAHIERCKACRGWVESYMRAHGR